MSPTLRQVRKRVNEPCCSWTCLDAPLYRNVCVFFLSHACTTVCLCCEMMHDGVSVSTVQVCMRGREGRGMGVYLGWLRCSGTSHCRVWLPAKLLCYHGNMVQPGIQEEQPSLTVFGLFLLLGPSCQWPTSLSLIPDWCNISQHFSCKT